MAHLTTIMMGVIVGTAEALGIAVDPDQPIHDAVPNNPASALARRPLINAAAINTRHIRFWVLSTCAGEGD